VVPEGPEDPTQDEQPQDGDHRDRDRMPGRL
jgi:hypothetical protein